MQQKVVGLHDIWHTELSEGCSNPEDWLAAAYLDNIVPPQWPLKRRV